jgi:hypothetical protein
MTTMFVFSWPKANLFWVSQKKEKKRKKERTVVADMTIALPHNKRP